ncbi:MAG: hypothetical protein LBR07_02290 [Puniceicoccales bacterium]|jgi:hypothetical protein|nr:hypothetical protein [Puniceicoccales bacterium]
MSPAGASIAFRAAIVVAGSAALASFAAPDAAAQGLRKGRIKVTTSTGSGSDKQVQDSYSYDGTAFDAMTPEQRRAFLKAREEKILREQGVAAPAQPTAPKPAPKTASGATAGAAAGAKSTAAGGAAAPKPADNVAEARREQPPAVAPAVGNAPSSLRDDLLANVAPPDKNTQTINTVLPDGRVLPWRVPKRGEARPVATNASFLDSLFSTSGDAKPKPVDESADTLDSLRNLTRMNERFGARRFDDDTAGARWHGDSRFDPGDREPVARRLRWALGGDIWGGTRFSRIGEREFLDAESLDAPAFDTGGKGVREHRTSRFDGTGADAVRNAGNLLDSTRESNLAERGTRRLRIVSDDGLGKRVELSMQSINRYSFRRAHSSDPGQPAAAPGGGVRVNSR